MTVGAPLMTRGALTVVLASTPVVWRQRPGCLWPMAYGLWELTVVPVPAVAVVLADRPLFRDREGRLGDGEVIDAAVVVLAVAVPGVVAVVAVAVARTVPVVAGR